MMFFIVPAGISHMPGGDNAVRVFGLMFFMLLLLAGLSSSVSLVEALASALIDKFKISRTKAITIFCTFGAVGSSLFTLPHIVNPGLENGGTLGLTLVDLVDHWAFSYGLLIVGLLECLLIGWIFGVKRLRDSINVHSRWKLGTGYDVLIRFVIPALILFVLGWSVMEEFRDGLYGSSYGPNFADGFRWMASSPIVVLFSWLGVTVVLAWVFTTRGSYESDES
jgi:NSS family neurotransmitter:Na+ symporter